MVCAANPLRPAYRNCARHGERALGMLLAAAVAELSGGRVYRWRSRAVGFAFDNEGPRHNVYLAPFRLASRLVTNGEYLEFMQRWRLQHSAAVAFRWLGLRAQPMSGSAPLYWEKRDGEWLALHAWTDGAGLRLNEPVCHVSFYEADAFARWAGARLPTEFEWEVAAQTCRSRRKLCGERMRCIRGRLDRTDL